MSIYILAPNKEISAKRHSKKKKKKKGHQLDAEIAQVRAQQTRWLLEANRQSSRRCQRVSVRLNEPETKSGVRRTYQGLTAPFHAP